ncbi:hypothetical protein [Anaerocellum danielii]|uniref:Uncharacterized protein n=1 Tax=Anaerocellum danielii TaxID=1387557 RepID=A0ABZ0TZ90_9FIRM|nr:hypothetical protein [Caldicellulosiruptor danielii]WPX08796.1 hypothetical protein SOJ16_002706 [Caldicellulosiruptor danielii]
MAQKFWYNHNEKVFKYYFPYKDDSSLKFGGAYSKCSVDIENVPEDLLGHFEMRTEYRSAQFVLIKNENIPLF